MPSEAVVGMDHLQRKLKKLERPARSVAKGMTNYYQDIQGRAEEYAPLSPANRPPAPYYVRGTGTFTGQTYQKTSQKMSNKWIWKVQRMGNRVRLVIKNMATYSSFVIGEKQTRYHSMRGWLRVDKYVEMTEPRALREIEKQIDRDILSK